MDHENVFPLEEIIRWTGDITGYGLTSERKKIIDLIRETLDALRVQESVDNLRRWRIYSHNGCITLPREIGVAEKYKIGEEIGPVRGLAYEFLGFVRSVDCEHFKTDLRLTGEFATFYDLPSSGARVAAQSIDQFECSKDWDKRPYIQVQGKDLKGREVFTNLDTGKMDQGERVYISLPNENPQYSRNIFASPLSGVRLVNAPLNVKFVWCNAENYGDKPYEVGPLATYDAGDEIPSFRRYYIPGISHRGCHQIEVLGKLRMPPLIYNNELIRGFDSFVLRSMISANWYRSQNDLNSANLNASLSVGQLRKSNEVKTGNETDNLAPFKATCAANFPKMY